jgi:hypothetical protein
MTNTITIRRYSKRGRPIVRTLRIVDTFRQTPGGPLFVDAQPTAYQTYRDYRNAHYKRSGQ